MDPHAQLAHVLADMFSPEELYLFLKRGLGGQSLVQRLPERVGLAPASYVDAVVSLLRREGAIDRDLFERLLDERPRREAELRRLAAAFGFADLRPPRAVARPGDSPVMDAGKPRWLVGVGLAAVLGLAIYGAVQFGRSTAASEGDESSQPRSREEAADDPPPPPVKSAEPVEKRDHATEAGSGGQQGTPTPISPGTAGGGKGVRPPTGTGRCNESVGEAIGNALPPRSGRSIDVEFEVDREGRFTTEATIPGFQGGKVTPKNHKGPFPCRITIKVNQ